MFIEPPGLQQTMSGRTVQAPGRWVVPMLRQEGDSQVEDRRWYQQDHTWEAEMIPSDIDTRGRDNSTGQWRGETASMVGDMGGRG